MSVMMITLSGCQTSAKTGGFISYDEHYQKNETTLKGNLYAVQKEILHRMYGLELGSVRLPLAPLVPEDEVVVVEAQKMIEAAIAEL